ncbi:MAG: hypothetical protein WA874_23295 [Chryseosolibacter sp.]
MKKERLHLATLIFGSILALAIAFSQFVPPASPGHIEKAKTEQAENTAGKDAASFISLPSFSLPAPIHLQVNLDPHCLFEIFFEEDKDENQVEDDLLHTDRFFETMFRVIISPNAP